MTEHRGPGLDPAVPIDQEAPADLADVASSGPAGQESSNGRLNPVGCHDQVVFTFRAISEVDVHRAAILGEGCGGDSQTYRHIRAPLEEDAMKLGPGDPDAGTDHSPGLGEIDFGEDSPPVIEQTLMRYADRATQELVDEAQRPESSDPVGREVTAPYPAPTTTWHARQSPGRSPAVEALARARDHRCRHRQ